MTTPYKFENILSDEKEKERFCDWFWSGTAGNDLIVALNLNNSKSSGSQIRRKHCEWLHIYCVVLNDDENPGKAVIQGKETIQWRYCKVGKTEKDTTSGSNNRMETVQGEIERKTEKKAGIIFVVNVNGTDSRPNNEVEKSVRKAIGWPVDKKLACENKFPVPTEWVLTTQKCINDIKKRGVSDTRSVLDLRIMPPKENLPIGLELQESTDKAGQQHYLVKRKPSKKSNINILHVLSIDITLL